MKKILILNRRAPYGTSHAREALDMALAAAAFGQEVSVVFVDDGVFQLKKQQDPAELSMKNFSLTFQALELYDIRAIYVEQESLQKRDMSAEDLLLPVTRVDSATLAQWITEHDIIMSF